MKILGLDFVRTCDACPEQYDVYTKNGTMIGYVRLRWGRLTARQKVGENKLVFDAYLQDTEGGFSSEEQRTKYLTLIAKALLAETKNTSADLMQDFISAVEGCCFSIQQSILPECKGLTEQQKEDINAEVSDIDMYMSKMRELLDLE